MRAARRRRRSAAVIKGARARGGFVLSAALVAVELDSALLVSHVRAVGIMVLCRYLHAVGDDIWAFARERERNGG